MDICKVKRARYEIVIAFSVVCVAIMLVLLLCWREISRPVSPQLTIGNLSSAMDGAEHQVLLGDVCYLLSDCEDLASICCCDSWVPSKSLKSGQRVLTFKLAEQYELAFYENGFVQAYDGYSGRKYRGNAWYQIPENVVSELAEYVAAKGTVQQMALGPKSWFVLTE